MVVTATTEVTTAVPSEVEQFVTSVPQLKTVKIDVVYKVVVVMASRASASMPRRTPGCAVSEEQFEKVRREWEGPGLLEN